MEGFSDARQCAHKQGLGRRMRMAQAGSDLAVLLLATVGGATTASRCMLLDVLLAVEAGLQLHSSGSERSQSCAAMARAFQLPHSFEFATAESLANGWLPR